METDAAGYTKRYAGEQYVRYGRLFTILANKGLSVLCPCPDSLLVRFEDTQEETLIDNSNEFVRFNGNLT
jgi:hypothetical protein